ncbi:G-type lectin S-receptor-like serine/threonine-protein kinase [Pyrus ussuriensis x Pyrus communis]|uniref:G-type lectin S-receptor-like serine/threonine-protein kinase n=1 Tax=Pyrus ussuriensis x Pyrus communis TaxID=2448454 RepID=A0A5N5GJL5_9ROSA|nr:G-type lectin S-receptor-like serine/threonine-protein kinase [Pyrus ussuriensis x Pyrus communis]
MLRKVSNSDLPVIKSTPGETTWFGSSSSSAQVITCSSCELSCILLSVDKSDVQSRKFLGGFSIEQKAVPRIASQVAIVQQMQDMALALGMFRRICRPNNCLVVFEKEKMAYGVDYPTAKQCLKYPEYA